MQRGRAARAPRPAAGRDPQQGHARRAAHGLPVGFVWGEEDGEVLLDPDEAVRGAIETIFERFAELGSVRQVWLWMRREGMQFPLRRFQGGEIRGWPRPTTRSTACLESPVYAGAYAFGKTRRERYVDEHGQPRTADASSLPRQNGGS